MENGIVIRRRFLPWFLSGLLALWGMDPAQAQAQAATNAPTGAAVKASPWGLPTPTNGATVPESLGLLDWDDMPDARWYEVSVGTNPAPGEGFGSGRLARSQWSVMGQLTAGRTYYWRVVGGGDYGRTTGEVWRFTVAESLLPAMPTNPIPEDGATSVDLSLILLDWSDSERARSYNVSCGTNALFAGGADSEVTPISRLPLRQRLRPGTTYYWRVISRNAAGSSTGGVWRFSTRATAASATVRR